MSDTVIETIDEIERSYEYLVAFASQSEETEVEGAAGHVETMRDGLRDARTAFDREDAPPVASFFAWAAEQTEHALGALELYLDNGDVNPESVEALLSLPSLRDCLTILLFLEEIGEL